ncbi:MAG: HAD hydrolase-like protein [Planctomycetes bacterium]|nr:HAD hydrolase-like protein [Planctomycetota bacterium]
MSRLVDLFVFDLAGTVVVDDDQVFNAFVATCRVFDLRVDPAALRSRMGWHKEQVFRSLLGELGREPGAAPEMAHQFEVEYATAIRRAPLRPTHGAPETLLALASAGMKIAFNTGFSRSTADLVLREMGLDRWPSVASDEVENGRPAPDLILRAMALSGVDDPQRVGVAGDTPSDLGAGTAAGVRFVVGLGCGTHTLEQLATCPHTHLLPDLSALPELVLVS